MTASHSTGARSMPPIRRLELKREGRGSERRIVRKEGGAKMTKEQLRCLKKIRTHLLKDNPPDQQMVGGLDNIINEYDMFNRPIL